MPLRDFLQLANIITPVRLPDIVGCLSAIKSIVSAFRNSVASGERSLVAPNGLAHAFRRG